ncbi:MAG: inositol monophosphatase [Candidatus Beckwithbacteria bacterium]
MIDLIKALTVAETAAVSAGDWLKKHQSSVKIVKRKGCIDIQTDADLKAESLIINKISKVFPSHNILSEEAGLTDHQSEYTWIIDPLDGTVEYQKGHSDYLVLIALENSHEILAGSVYSPSLKNLYSASKLTASTKNHHPIKVSQTKTLSQSVITIKLPNLNSSPSDKVLALSALRILLDKFYRVRSSTLDALNICLVAEGVIEAFCLTGDFGPKWWDLAPSLIIAKQAGAKISDCFGKPIKNHNLSHGIVVTNGLIHDQLLNILNH